MTKNLLDLSGKVSQEILDVVAAVAETANHLSIPFLIVGAAARDFLLEHAHGIRSGRETGDIDFGVYLNSWEEHAQFAEQLCVSAGFRPDRQKPHRFQAPNMLLIDVIPFGPIAGLHQIITWPKDEDRMMSVEGFAVAMDNAASVLLRLEPRLVIAVASLPALALMKILSWHGAYPARPRDGHDFYIIMNKYADTVDISRLSAFMGNLPEGVTPAVEEIGAQLLGHDMANIAEQSTARRIVGILHEEQDETGPLRLLPALRTAAGLSVSDDQILALLRAVERGFSPAMKEK